MRVQFSFPYFFTLPYLFFREIVKVVQMLDFLVFFESTTLNISLISSVCLKPELVGPKLIKLLRNWAFRILIEWRLSIMLGVFGLVGKTQFEWKLCTFMLNSSLLGFGPIRPHTRSWFLLCMAVLTIKVVKIFGEI